MNDRDPRPGDSVPARQVGHTCPPVTSYPEDGATGNWNPIALLPSDTTPQALRDWFSRAWDVPVEFLNYEAFDDAGFPVGLAACEGTV